MSSNPPDQQSSADVPVVGTKSAVSNIKVKFKSVIGLSPASLAYVVTILCTEKLDLMARFSIIILYLKSPLDTSNDCANVVGFVAKSERGYQGSDRRRHLGDPAEVEP